MVFVVSFMSGLAALIVGATTHFSEAEVTRIVEENAQQTGKLIHQQIGDRIQLAGDHVRLLTQSQSVIDIVRRGRASSSAKITVATLAKPLNHDFLAVYDGVGRPAYQRGLVFGPEDASKLKALKRKSKRDASASEIIPTRFGLVLFSAGRVRVDQHRVGTLIVGKRVDVSLAREISRTLVNHLIFVVGNRTYASTIPVSRKFEFKRRGIQILKLQNVEFAASYNQLSLGQRYSIGYLSLVSRSVLHSPFDSIKAYTIVVSCFSILLAYAVGYVVTRSVLRPVDQVMDAATLVQQGEWPQPFASERKDQLGMLQNVFDQMIESLKASQDQYVRMLSIDPLTETLNHRRFKQHLEDELKSAEIAGTAVTLVLVDLDHFGRFNQKWGNVRGDEVLQKVAEIIKGIIPQDCFAARYGGEEFALLLPGWSQVQAQDIAEIVRQRIDAQTTQWGFPITASIGVAPAHEVQYDPQMLILAVELSIQSAQAKGRNMVVGFDSQEMVGDHPGDLRHFLQQGDYAAILALAEAVDAKDPYTRGHSYRVARYAGDLARRVELPAEVVDLIYTAATLHDVGKIGVPDAILQKQERLDQDERLVMEEHPALGERIISRVPQLAPTLPAVRHHHERWDGHGYPDKLVGEDIPYLARILSIADTFDAMTSDRPYRKGLPFETALYEIEKMAGTQFDPYLGKVFVEMMREKIVDKPDFWREAA